MAHNGIFGKTAMHVHHCPDCGFMGHTNGYDLYFCNGRHGVSPGTWIIARFGDDPLDYTACREGLGYKNILIIADRLYKDKFK